jgi:NAD(P)-dependent dehydrogenase (short-subunit alcohol dehydrogenase family)
MKLEGKRVLVTGGAHRVGGTITHRLAMAGACVAFTYHTAAAAAHELTCVLEELGCTVTPIPCDIGDADAVARMADAATRNLGGVDIIVNSASLFRATPFPGGDLSEWHAVTRVAMDGVYMVCDALVPGMQAHGAGAIINIIDSCIWKPIPGFLAHAAAKGALSAMTRQMAVDLAPHVRVNGVAPGPILPPAGLPEARRRAIAQSTLLQRWGEADDVAHAVIYLIEAEYVTGEIIAVDGGERLSRG